MFEERKRELRDQLRVAQLVRSYPRRDQAKFNDENDHNPSILADCPQCLGSGTRCFYELDGSHSHDTCETCGGCGTSFEIEPYFKAEAAASVSIDVRPNAFGWLECPKCHLRFLPADKRVWTGLRHRICGQKIHIADA